MISLSAKLKEKQIWYALKMLLDLLLKNQRRKTKMQTKEKS